jgi:hypothetical protein
MSKSTALLYENALRAEAAEHEIRDILKALKANCTDDFVVIIDGAIDWARTIDEFVSFVQLDAKENNHGGT